MLREMLITGFIAAGIFLQSCSSFVLPPKLSKKQVKNIQPIPLSVAVDTRKSFYFDRLIRDIQESHLFKHVDTIDKLPNADVVLSIDTWLYSDGSNIPFWPLISFGIIPEIYTDDYGLDMKFRRNHRWRQRADVDVQYGYSSTTVLGWICLPLNLLPDRFDSCFKYYETKRFNRQVIYTIALKRDDIMKLYDARN